MKQKNDFRYDPLYRVIDETEEMRIVEGNFKSLFDRLKRINNLGLIPEVFDMAKYPKYEHGLGTTYQVNSLLEVADEYIIPTKYRKPLILASLFLHLGHLPYTYSTERALLLASNLGDRNTDNKIKKYVLKRVKKAHDKANIDDEKKQIVLDNILSLRSYKNLYKFFSAEILVEKWGNLKKKIDGLSEEDLEIIVKDLIDTRNNGYMYLNLADKADFVQRDALYFGTVRIDISPRHLYGGLSKYKPRFSVSEEKLIEYNLCYLNERFYDNPNVDWFSRLYEKILASLIISKNFKIEWLEHYDDAQFKRLIHDDLDKDNNKIGLPSTWRNRVKKLFQNDIRFNSIFDLRDVFFQKEKDILDIEYKLIGKKIESERGLLTYPFDKGVLLAIDCLDKSKYPIHPNYQTFSIRVFQDESKKSFSELLKIVNNLNYHLSFSHVKNIRNGLANQLSWTKDARFSNEGVIYAISDTIKALDNEDYEKRDFIDKYLKSLSNISTFGDLWHNFENQYIWKGQIRHFLEQHRDELEKEDIYNRFTEGLVLLPVQLLQYKSTKKYIDEIYNKLLEKISTDISNDDRGDLFEALWLMDKMRTKKGKFQFFLNGMVVIDTDNPVDKQDDNEFDVIELVINEKAECWIYACSIADDYESKNKEQITKLAEHIHKEFPNLIVCTRYIVPNNKNAGDWYPREEDAGRNYNQK